MGFELQNIANILPQGVDLASLAQQGQQPAANPLPTPTVAPPAPSARDNAITGFYQNLLGRTPSTAEEQGWSNGNLDLNAIQQQFLSSPEYQGLHPAAIAQQPVPIAQQTQQPSTSGATAGMYPNASQNIYIEGMGNLGAIPNSMLPANAPVTSANTDPTIAAAQNTQNAKNITQDQFDMNRDVLAKSLYTLGTPPEQAKQILDQWDAVPKYDFAAQNAAISAADPYVIKAGAKNGVEVQPGNWSQAAPGFAASMKDTAFMPGFLTFLGAMGGMSSLLAPVAGSAIGSGAASLGLGPGGLTATQLGSALSGGSSLLKGDPAGVLSAALPYTGLLDGAGGAISKATGLSDNLSNALLKGGTAAGITALTGGDNALQNGLISGLGSYGSGLLSGDVSQAQLNRDATDGMPTTGDLSAPVWNQGNSVGEVTPMNAPDAMPLTSPSLESAIGTVPSPESILLPGNPNAQPPAPDATINTPQPGLPTEPPIQVTSSALNPVDAAPTDTLNGQIAPTQLAAADTGTQTDVSPQQVDITPPAQQTLQNQGQQLTIGDDGQIHIVDAPAQNVQNPPLSTPSDNFQNPVLSGGGQTLAPADPAQQILPSQPDTTPQLTINPDGSIGLVDAPVTPPVRPSTETPQTPEQPAPTQQPAPEQPIVPDQNPSLTTSGGEQLTIGDDGSIQIVPATDQTPIVNDVPANPGPTNTGLPPVVDLTPQNPAAQTLQPDPVDQSLNINPDGTISLTPTPQPAPTTTTPDQPSQAAIDRDPTLAPPTDEVVVNATSDTGPSTGILGTLGAAAGAGAIAGGGSTTVNTTDPTASVSDVTPVTPTDPVLPSPIKTPWETFLGNLTSDSGISALTQAAAKLGLSALSSPSGSTNGSYGQAAPATSGFAQSGGQGGGSSPLAVVLSSPQTQLSVPKFDSPTPLYNPQTMQQKMAAALGGQNGY